MAIEVRTLTPGGQTPLEVAREVAAFLGAARRSLELALYDVRLPDPAGGVVAGALRDASGRGVSVRIAYNEDHGKPVPVPPPPRTRPDILAELPCTVAPIPGTPDLMHHKYVVRDDEAILTGSTNWTEDSWSLQENVMLTAESTPLAAAFAANFEELWRTRDVERTGRVEPEPVDVAGVEVRPWFTPGHGPELSHRIARAIGRARERVRLASPVLTAAPVLSTLAQVVADGRLDVAGVVDDTQVDQVVHQWRTNGQSAWKVPVLGAVLGRGLFAGKHSTPWAQDTPHDFMHAKVTVADDVAFAGSFNLSHSGEQNAENVLELRDAALADRLAAFIDEIRASYPPASVPG
jgi:phosphatidylserine/phosphatidylglycerophosphate/cardiolipin synthase-like enzyme